MHYKNFFLLIKDFCSFLSKRSLEELQTELSFVILRVDEDDVRQRHSV